MDSVIQCYSPNHTLEVTFFALILEFNDLAGRHRSLHTGYFSDAYATPETEITVPLR